MEQNNFEELEAVEIEEKVEYKPEPELKEYQKLLLKEANREDYEKALNLVKFGCFNQEEKESIDFSRLESIPTAKKFKGIYKLYRNLDTMELLFICPLVENNKGDSEENKNMKPYAYDVITIEAMDKEEYQMVKKAARNNLSSVVKTLYYGSFAAFFTVLTIWVLTLLFCIIKYAEQGLEIFLTSTVVMLGAMTGALAVAVPLLLIAAIKYRKYKDQ